jgi:hypothetical protein
MNDSGISNSFDCLRATEASIPKLVKTVERRKAELKASV